ncbi:hypothetical protein G6F57_001034 [Rhizopus arrhizus]|nr:hypothetical protein G6F30_002676 [Rhizopus arrhizus]KAG1427860.1 hypothetical protein G6F58_000833 [Rhizopus delemar]KAG0987141.1 hypothetical protein G6F29_002727 [Rhizopus arrhizus]KAG0998274.1 hypothetical protein G6F28_002099 [Rhizopus arrhizus]KAG1013370.1 hypothetical protein G6F27_001947 [Rhizopus arrhizus]
MRVQCSFAWKRIHHWQKGNDNSISKKHATIHIGPITISDLENVNYKPDITITAHETSYGTRLNGELLNGSVPLHHEDILQLGSLGFYMKVRWKPVAVCRNAAKSIEKKKLVRAALRAGFNVLKKWNSRCTHLYMTDLIVSDRLIYALVNNKPIVSDKWLDKLIELGDVEEADAAIEPVVLKDYGPLKKTIELTYNPNREELFESIEFWIFTKAQYDRLEFLIRLCRGEIKLIDLDDNIDMNQLRETTVFIQPVPELLSNDQWIALERQFCSHHGFVRTIPEHEMIYSVLYCSTNTLCNPRVHYPFEASTTAIEPGPHLQTPIENQTNQSSDRLETSSGLHRSEANPPVSLDPASSNEASPVSCSGRGTIPFDPSAKHTYSERDTLPFNPSSVLPSITRSQADTVPFDPSRTLRSVSHSEQDTVPFDPSKALLPEANTTSFNSSETLLLSKPEPLSPNHDWNDESKDLSAYAETGSLAPSLNQFFNDMVGDFEPLPPPSDEKVKDKDSKPANHNGACADAIDPTTIRSIETKTPLALSSSANATTIEHKSVAAELTTASEVFDTELLTTEPPAPSSPLSSTPISTESFQVEPLTAESQQTTDSTTETRTTTTQSSSHRPAVRSSSVEDDVPSAQVVYVKLVKNTCSPITQSSSSSTGVNYKRFRKVQQSYDPIHIVRTTPPQNEQHQRLRDNERVPRKCRVENTELFDPDITIRVNRRR